MNTPTNGPSRVNGKIVTALAASSPLAVFCWSGLKTTDATSAAWKIPSPPCPHRRIHKSLRKSPDRRADRTRAAVPGWGGALIAPQHTGAPEGARATALCGSALDGLASRGAVDDLERGIAVGELLDHLASLFVGELHRRALHQVRARSDDRAADATVHRQLGAPQGVDDHAGRVRRVPHLELHLDVQRHVAEVAALEPDHRPLAVLEPGHVVARADVDALLRQRLVELGLDGVGLRDLLRCEAFALEHVHEVHVAAEVELIRAVELD